MKGKITNVSANGGVVVIDTPPGTSCPVVASVKDSDFCVLVTEPTPFGLNDLILAVGMVRELGIPFGVVINRILCQGKPPNRRFSRVKGVLRGALAEDL